MTPGRVEEPKSRVLQELEAFSTIILPVEPGIRRRFRH